MNSITAAVESWSAWIPDDNSHDAKADASFVDPLLRRRLSKLSRMAVWAARDCLKKSRSPENITLVFCSQYGEFERTCKILQTLVEKDMVSPMAFTQSVHNTSVGIFSIVQKSRAAATTISSGRSSFECAFLESWAELCANNQSKVLLVYHDETAPEIYDSTSWSVKSPIAFALLLAPYAENDDATALRLNWTAQPPKNNPENSGETSSPRQILSLLQANEGSCTISTDRLEWAWSVLKNSTSRV